MPLVSQFYGIFVYMYKEIGGHHNKPHMHIKYNEYEMSISLEGELLEGKIPNKQRKLVEAWIIIHKEELKYVWDKYCKEGEIIKIKGLE